MSGLTVAEVLDGAEDKPVRYIEIERGVFVDAADFVTDPDGCREAAALAREQQA